MNRRELLKHAVAMGGALSLAGCQGGNSCDPDIQKTDQTSNYIQPSGNYVFLTSGNITNVSDCSIDSVHLEGFLLDKNDDMVLQNDTYVRDISPDDDEIFIIKFHATKEDWD
jgi:hypothetical protein